MRWVVAFLGLLAATLGGCRPPCDASFVGVQPVSMTGWTPGYAVVNAITDPAIPFITNCAAAEWEGSDAIRATVEDPLGAPVEVKNLRVVDSAYWVGGESAAPGIAVITEFLPIRAGPHRLSVTAGETTSTMTLMVQTDRRAVALRTIPKACSWLESVGPRLWQCGNEIVGEDGGSAGIGGARLVATLGTAWALDESRIRAFRVSGDGSISPPVSMGTTASWNGFAIAESNSLFVATDNGIRQYRLNETIEALGFVATFSAGSKVRSFAVIQGSILAVVEDSDGSTLLCESSEELGVHCSAQAPDAIATADMGGVWVRDRDVVSRVTSLRSTNMRMRLSADIVSALNSDVSAGSSGLIIPSYPDMLVAGVSEGQLVLELFPAMFHQTDVSASVHANDRFVWGFSEEAGVTKFAPREFDQ